MAQEKALEPGICAAVSSRAVKLPVFDESTFDQDYFAGISNYAGRYDWFNPRHKIVGYLREIRRLRPAGSLLDVPAYTTRLARGRLHDLLAPAGLLAVAAPVHDSPAGWVFGIIDRDPTHIHRFGRLEWLRRLKRAGLAPIVFKGILRVPLPGYFVHAISPVFRWCSSAIFVMCVREDKIGSG